MEYHRLASVVVGFCILMSASEAVLQREDDNYLRVVTRNIFLDAGAHDRRSQIVAIRDYLRSHISYHGAPYWDRPFLRDTAVDTLRTGLGYCGEDTRAFICMAATDGIWAQRINLVGRDLHVVAEAEVTPGDDVIVDCQNPPHIRDLESLDQVMQRPEYSDYYTLNLRRFRVAWLIARLKLQMGPLTFWTENPHAMKAVLWGVPVILMALGVALRRLLRHVLHRRGWVHLSNMDRHLVTRDPSP